MKQIIYIAVVMLAGCSMWQPKHREGVAVELNGQELTFTQLDEITRNAQSTEDSAARADAYIFQWASDILEYTEAQDRASADLESLVEDYRRTLYIHEYEQKMVARHQPKNWPDSLVERIYEQQKEQMRLKETILKGVLLVVPQGTPKIAQMKSWLTHLTDDNIEKIEKYAFQYATGYEYFPTQWYTSNQIILRLPLQNNFLEEKLSKNNQIVIEDSTSVYVLQITDKRLVGDIMPIECARENIEQLLLNDWKINFLKKERQQLFDAAQRYDKLKRYER